VKKIIPIFIICLFALVTAQFLLSSSKLLKFPAQDFEVFYLAGQFALKGENPYQRIPGKDPFKNPPPALLVFAPLASLPILQSQALWFISSITAYLIASFYLFKIVGWSGWKKWLIFLTATIVFFPFRYNLGSGQINNILFLFIILNFYFLRTKPMKSALSLAGAIMLRVTPLFFMFSLLTTSRLKQIHQTFLGLLVLAIIAFVFFGPSIYQNYQQGTDSYLNFGISSYYNQSIDGLLSRTLNQPHTHLVIILVLLVTLLSTIYFQSRRIKDGFLRDLTLWSIGTICLLIFAPYSWQYNFVVIIFSLVATFHLGRKLMLPKIFFGLLGLSYLLLGANIKNPLNFTGLLGGMILSHVLIGALILLALDFYILKKLQKSKA